MPGGGVTAWDPNSLLATGFEGIRLGVSPPKNGGLRVACRYPFPALCRRVTCAKTGKRMLKFKITRGVAVGMAVVGAFALTACVGDKSEASPAVAQLGSPVKVSGSSGWSGDGDYSGTVTVDPGPACALDDDGRVVVFHVRAGAEKGSVPTGNWRLQTGNADPVSNGHFDLGDFAGPLIGSPVDTDKAWGDIAFHLPPKTVPTRLQLFAGDDRYSNSPGVALAQWATPMEVKASVYCSGPLQAAVKRETPVTN